MKYATIALLLCAPLFAKTVKMDQPITVAADGAIQERVALVNGTSVVYRLFTNYIVVADTKTAAPIQLTITCEVRWTWQHCFTMQKDGAYTAQFEYHYSAKKRDMVTVTGQPKGNLTAPQSMKSVIVDFKELSPSSP